MNIIVELAIAAVVGLLVGYAIGARGKGSRTEAGAGDDETQWWKLRDTLSGTQLQILQYLEAKKEASITALQEKFSFIPDRELFYRLEQIVLMNFIQRDRKHGEIVYKLNPDYSGRVEGDKTVILPEE